MLHTVCFFFFMSCEPVTPTFLLRKNECLIFYYVVCQWKFVQDDSCMSVHFLCDKDILAIWMWLDDVTGHFATCICPSFLSYECLPGKTCSWLKLEMSGADRIYSEIKLMHIWSFLYCTLLYLCNNNNNNNNVSFHPGPLVFGSSVSDLTGYTCWIQCVRH